MLVDGTLSLGFKINVFPKVIAKGIIHKGIIAGKLNGAIPAQTPKGNLYEWVSIPRAALKRVSPIDKDAIAQPCSTTSRPYLKWNEYIILIFKMSFYLKA